MNIYKTIVSTRDLELEFSNAEESYGWCCALRLRSPVRQSTFTKGVGLAADPQASSDRVRCVASFDFLRLSDSNVCAAAAGLSEYATADPIQVFQQICQTVSQSGAGPAGLGRLLYHCSVYPHVFSITELDLPPFGAP